MDRSGGKSLDFKPMKDPATGKGMAVKSMDAGGQLEAKGVAKVGTVFTHVNGTAVADMSMKEIGAIIKSQDTVTIKFQSGKAGGAEVPDAAEATPSLPANGAPTISHPPTQHTRTRSRILLSAGAFSAGQVGLLS